MSDLVVANQEIYNGIFKKNAVDYKVIVETYIGNETQLSHVDEATDYWISSNTMPQVRVKFATPVLLTNYTIFKEFDHSYPLSFALYGKQNNRYIELDSRYNQSFDGDTIHSIRNTSVTYTLNHSILLKDVILKQFDSSEGYKYMLLRGLEFYGVVCQSCKLLSYASCRQKRKTVFQTHLFLIISLIS